ncbi:hypothetical protein Moror_4323 [Moniliophthora roreri MCA 2997]|uniref:F-box domain-containing protein n=1 Tax=Moniliophthora roreri (strain MCA 2997) TaxID=1381753 RepID=V2XG01_MONRO|nr:hypothetical protein Moror_4323 [Moniliophthora roreri MCA 2997]
MSFEAQRRIYDRADPRFDFILRSGRTVSPSDWAFARGILEENESLTQHHENALQILKENHRTISSLFAPIRKVPPEVLSYIFAHFIGKNRFGPTEKDWESNASKLGGLEVIIDFSVSFDAFVLQDLKRHIERANHALDLTLTLEDEDDSENDNVIESLFLPSGEWRSLCLTVGVGCEQTAITILHNHLAEKLKLQSLELDLENATSDEGRVILNAFVSRSSLLRQIHLPASDSYLEPDNLGLYVPLLSRLTHLFIDNTTETILSLLEHCSGLVFAHFVVPSSRDADDSSERDDNDQNDNGTSRKMHRMLHLQDLAIEVPSTGIKGVKYPLQGAAQILQVITCPELQSLSLISDAGTNQSVSGPKKKISLLRSLHDFLERSQTLLLRLRVECIPFSDEEIISLLRTTPSLTQLTILETPRRGYPDEESHPESMYLLPRLRDLRIAIEWELNDDKFVDLVKSRLIESQPPFVPNPLSRLQSFYLKALNGDGGPEHVWFAETLRELKKERDLAVRFVSFKTIFQTQKGRRISKKVESVKIGHGEDDDHSDSEDSFHDFY